MQNNGNQESPCLVYDYTADRLNSILYKFRKYKSDSKKMRILLVSPIHTDTQIYYARNARKYCKLYRLYPRRCVVSAGIRVDVWLQEKKQVAFISNDSKKRAETTGF